MAVQPAGRRRPPAHLAAGRPVRDVAAGPALAQKCRPGAHFLLLPLHFPRLLGFTGLYRVLLSFTGFYWVLSGFTGFLPSFTGLY